MFKVGTSGERVAWVNASADRWSVRRRSCQNGDGGVSKDGRHGK